MGSSQTLIRGRLQHKYHFCGRCGLRTPLAELQWQSDVLVCTRNNCHDSMTASERDALKDRLVAIAATSDTELQIDHKLTDAALVMDDEIEFMP